jgi:AmmeMemoRadiSam system protein B
MSLQPARHAAVAGSWYPADPEELAVEVDRYLSEVTDTPSAESVVGLVAPHAGLMYSGPVAAWSYRAVQGGSYEVAVLVGPSHRAAFSGVALYPRGSFETPLGPIEVAEDVAGSLADQTPIITESPALHGPEHSLEMQLPFLRRVLPATPIVPMIMGFQSESTMRSLGDALAAVLTGRRALLIASSDLSHYLDARVASVTDREVLDCVERFDADGLMALLRDRPEHACGGGPMVSVMLASRALGARGGRVLRYADSGDVSGDKKAVVGYMSAAFVM